MRRFIWFSVSVLYSAISAGFATQYSGVKRGVLVSLAVHGGLWAIYRAIGLVAEETYGLSK